MSQPTITFIVKASTDESTVIRSINSIRRQNQNNCNIIAYTNKKALTKNIKEMYPDIKVIRAKNNVDFCEKFNKNLEKIKTDYCVIINGDEVVSPNASEALTSYDDDAVIFNISKKKGLINFSPVYNQETLEDTASYLKGNQSVWAIAFKPKLLIKNKIELLGFSYEDQSLFVLSCISHAKSVAFHNNVIAYKESFKKPETISFEFFDEHKDIVLDSLEQFIKFDKSAERKQVIQNYILPCLEDYYNDKSFISRQKKKRMLRKYMGI